MKKTFIMTIVTSCLALAGCQQQLKSGIDIENLDMTADPGTDFYQYATGGWQKLNPLTAEYSRFGSFDLLDENNRKRLQDIITDVSSKQNAEGSIEQKIADLYNAAMDSVTLNKEGLDNLKAFLDTPWPKMLRQGVSGLFDIYITADDKDSKNNLVTISQGGLTLGQKDYYVEQDSATVAIREAYVTYIKALAQHAGFTADEATQMTADVMRIETRLAKASKSMTDLRDPEANYNKMTYEALKDTFPGIAWDEYMANLSLTDVKEVNVGQPMAIHEVEKVLAEESAEAMRNYQLWHALNMASSFVDDESRKLSFDFWGTALSGKEEDRPRWKRALSSVEGSMGEALGQIYVARYFPPEAKERMEKLVANLQVALGQRIDEQDWMSEETKKVAHEKLDAFYVKVGYPNKWTDYSTLEVKGSYLDMILACNEWGWEDMVDKHLNKPVDREEWYMTPQTVNAYYNPTTNEICFPAGILQPPFFDMDADDAFNYGAIGVVIGHEMTHGFDDQGARYDKDGNLRTWWSDEDTKRFTERIQVMREFHDNIEVLPGLHANGSLTLGENMADHGGIMVAYQALQNVLAEAPLEDIDGFTPNQRFFLAYGNVWAQNVRDAEIRRLSKSDPHALAKWRVNGQLPHIDAWYEAFGITEKSPMFVPKEKRVTIW